MSMAKALVTGAAGFIGGRMVAALLKQGRRVRAIVRPGGRTLPKHLLERAEVVEADLTDRGLSPRLFEGVESVFHLAGGYLPGFSPRVGELLRRINVDCTRSVAEAASAAGVRKIIHFSSIAADESAGVPWSAYGRSKRQSEEVFSRADWGALDWTILRPVVVFGEDHEGPIVKMARAIRRGRFVIFGEGRNHLCFLYIEDLVAAAMLAESSGKTSGRTYVLCDEPIPLNELIELLSRFLGVARSPPRIPLLLGRSAAVVCDWISGVTGRDMPLSSTRLDFMTRDASYSNQPFAEDTGFYPPVGVRAGIERTLNRCRQSGVF